MADGSPSSPSDSSSEGRLARAARTLAALARRLMTGVAVLGTASAGAGGLMWFLLWWPPSTRPDSLLIAAGSLAVLLAPATVLALFYLGLRDLLALPERLSARSARTIDQSTEAARAVVSTPASSVLGRLWNVVKQIWALRSILLENRALLLRYGTLIRFAHPGFLLLVVLAAGFSLILIPIAVVAGLLFLIL